MNDDMISRASAIDAVKKNTFRLIFAEEQNCEGRVAWSANAVYSDVIEGALKALPSAQPKRDIPLDCIIDESGNAICPKCGANVEWHKYCGECGQALKWEE